MQNKLFLLPVIVLVSGLAAGCAPTVQLQAPDKPIEINLNVNIEQRVRIEIERDVQQAISKNKDIF